MSRYFNAELSSALICAEYMRVHWVSLHFLFKWMLCFGWWCCLKASVMQIISCYFFTYCVAGVSIGDHGLSSNASSGVKRQISFRMRPSSPCFQNKCIRPQRELFTKQLRKILWLLGVAPQEDVNVSTFLTYVEMICSFSSWFLHWKMIVWCLRFFSCADCRC